MAMRMNNERRNVFGRADRKGARQKSLHSDHVAPHPAAKSKRPRKASAGQKEMLLPFGRKPAAKAASKKAHKRPAAKARKRA